jgi:hypothetical protein
MNRDRLRDHAFTFPMFMSELRKRFLEVQWENQIMRTVVNSKMNPSESFTTFANRVIAGNNLLEGTTIRLSVADLRKTLCANMSEFLASKLDRQKATERERLAAIETSDDWMQEIVSFDRETTADLKRIAEMMEESISKRQRLNDLSGNFENVPTAPPSSFHYPPNPCSMYQPPFVATGANAVQPAPFRQNENMAPRSKSSTSTTRTFCPTLTENDKYLLNKHRGCRKCRRFYVAHRVKDCPNDFPDGATYVPLTEDLAFETMRSSAVASTYTTPSTQSQHVVAETSDFNFPSRRQTSSSFSNAYTSYNAPAPI